MKSLLQSDIILLVQAATTWFLVGLIWMVQVVHYPLFANVGEARYPEYQQQHEQRITWIVGPTMVLELLIAVVLVAYPLPAFQGTSYMAWLGLALVVLVWLTTALISVPCHSRLATGFDASAHYWLVTSNWIRTFAWTCRGVIVLWMLHHAYRQPTG